MLILFETPRGSPFCYVLLTALFCLGLRLQMENPIALSLYCVVVGWCPCESGGGEIRNVPCLPLGLEISKGNVCILCFEEARQL